MHKSRVLYFTETLTTRYIETRAISSQLRCSIRRLTARCSELLLNESRLINSVIISVTITRYFYDHFNACCTKRLARKRIRLSAIAFERAISRIEAALFPRWGPIASALDVASTFLQPCCFQPTAYEQDGQ